MDLPPGIPTKKINSWDLISSLEKRGWKFHGSGSFSKVFTNEKYPFVLKVTEEYDRAFAHFAILTHKFPNKHFPVIGNAKILTDDNGNKYHLYVMEKLYKLDRTESRYFNNNFRLFSTFMNAMNWYDTDKLTIPVIRKTFEFINDENSNGSNFDKDTFKDFLRKNKSLIEALGTVAKYGKGQFDIHGDNIMKREDGTLVVIDPLAFYDKPFRIRD